MCQNPEAAGRRRRERVGELAKLAALSSAGGSWQSKRVCELRSIRRQGRHLRLTCGGTLRISRAGVQAGERLAGKFVARANDTLSADDMALGYRQLRRVEQA